MWVWDRVVDKVDFLDFQDPQSQEKKILSLIFGRRIRIRRENLKKVKGKKVSDVKRFEKSAKIDIFRLFRPSFFFGIKFWAILG